MLQNNFIEWIKKKNISLFLNVTLKLASPTRKPSWQYLSRITTSFVTIPLKRQPQADVKWSNRAPFRGRLYPYALGGANNERDGDRVWVLSVVAGSAPREEPPLAILLPAIPVGASRSAGPSQWLPVDTVFLISLTRSCHVPKVTGECVPNVSQEGCTWLSSCQGRLRRVNKLG